MGVWVRTCAILMPVAFTSFTLLLPWAACLPNKLQVSKPEPEVCFTICLSPVPDAQEQLCCWDAWPWCPDQGTCLTVTDVHHLEDSVPVAPSPLICLVKGDALLTEQTRIRHTTKYFMCESIPMNLFSLDHEILFKNVGHLTFSKRLRSLPVFPLVLSQ